MEKYDNMIPVIPIDFNVPVDKMLIEIDRLYSLFKPYSDKQHGMVDGWLIFNDISKTTIMKQTLRDFLEYYNFTGEARARYYILEEDTPLPPHIDYNTLCSCNFLLEGYGVPISYESGDYNYTNALIDTTRLHWVNNTKGRRILFKISIFDEGFEDFAKRVAD